MRLPGLLFATLVVAHPAAARTCEAVWQDPSRNRAIPVQLRLPDRVARPPVILYSHGLGGSNAGGAQWKNAWERAGFAVLSVQHPGSDSGVWQGASGNPYGSLMQAATPQQLRARVGDIGFALDRLEARAKVGDCQTAGLDLSRVGMAGHSFGAITTLALSGQRFPGGQSLADPRITAAIAFSPSAPRRGTPEAAFGAIGIPVFSLTGTKDSVPLSGQADPATRTLPFEAMPPGGKYLLVLAGATHEDLGGGSPRPRASAPDPRYVRLVTDSTTAFWKGTLGGDAAARRYLSEPAGFPATISRADSFKMK